jgi:UDP-N-acetylglucosamine acyltransferase
MPTRIHPTAMISSSAELGEDVEIGPYTLVGPQVTIGDRTRIGPHVVIEGVTAIGRDNQIVGQASLGTAPQDLSYKSEPTRLSIGDGNTIREFVTINRGTIKGGGVTRVGNGNLLMACCHVAHDCELKDGIIIGNNTLLAGHVLVEERANISGGAAAHHFVTIGAYSYVGGMTRMIQDVPPFVILEGHPSRVRGVNVVGLRRGGAPEEDIEALREAHRRLFRSSLPRLKTVAEMRAQPETSSWVLRLLDALERTSRGLKGRFRESMRQEFARQGVALILEGTSAR